MNIPNMIGSLGGYKVVVDNTMKYKTVKRTLKERWFSLPWKPFMKFKSIPDGYIIPDDKVYGYDRTIIVNPIVYDNLIKAQWNK